MNISQEFFPKSESSVHLALRPPDLVVRTYSIKKQMKGPSIENLQIIDKLPLDQPEQKDERNYQINSPMSPRRKKYRVSKKNIFKKSFTKGLTLNPPRKVMKKIFKERGKRT